VLDASAILAVVHQEPGWDKLPNALLETAVVSTVNLAEVQSKLVSSGWSPEDAWEDATSAVREVFSFSPEHAKTTGNLIAQTRPAGLSLGDRACLALALELNAPVYTTDRSWKNLKLSIPIHVIR
jgi:PIN domain nuclease of toxin-antitoxin system